MRRLLATSGTMTDMDDAYIDIFGEHPDLARWDPLDDFYRVDLFSS